MREGICERGDLLEGFTCACSMQPSVYSALRLRRGTLGAAIPPSDQEVRTRPPFVALCAPTKHQLPACVRHDRMRGAASRVEGHRAGARSKRARHTNVTRGLAAQDFLGGSAFRLLKGTRISDRRCTLRRKNAEGLVSEFCHKLATIGCLMNTDKSTGVRPHVEGEPCCLCV